MQWIKKHKNSIITTLVCVSFLIYCYGCTPQVRSLMHNDRYINRQELQLELDQFMGMAQLRLADLDKQEEFRAIVLQNALILVQGQPLNPVGIITAVAAVFGALQGGRTVKNVVKSVVNKRKVNNG